MPCLFCDKLNKEFYFETKYWGLVLSWDQTYLGRSMVVLKRHTGSLSELKKEEWTEFSDLLKKLESCFKRAFGATMFNWTCLMNDAYQEPNPEPHVHWHIRPRYSKSVKFAGLTFEDKEFGHHYDRSAKREVSAEVKQKIIDKIKSNL